MPRNVNPASVSVGAGIAPQGTVEDNSLRYPQRDTDSLRAHLLDPNKAHMASAIGIVDAGGFYASDEVEGALQELGGGGAAGRHNGLVLGGTFTSGPGLLTLDTPTQVLIGGVIASFGGATVALPPSATRYVWIDAATSTLTASAVLPPVSDEPILIAKVVTDAGANVTASQDARFFVANLDRKLDYTLRSDGSAVNDASEACFVTLDAALFWLENYVATAQERKAVVLVRGAHSITSTVVVPAGIPNVEFRGEGEASFATGAALAPMFDVSGTTGVTFTGLTFICNHALSTAISTNNAALACANVTVQGCRFVAGGATWAFGVRLYQATPNIQQGHRVLDSEVSASTSAVRIERAVDCVVRDCTLTGANAAASIGLALTRVGTAGENCLVENTRVVGGFEYPFDTNTFYTTLRKCLTLDGGVRVAGDNPVVEGCAFTGITNTTAGLHVLPSANGAVVSSTTVSSTTLWGGGDNPAGILVEAVGATVTGCSVTGFYNAAGNNGAGARSNGSASLKVVSSEISNCHTGVEILGTSGVTVEGCTLAALVRGVYSDPASQGTRVVNTGVALDAATGLHGVVLESVGASVLGCQVVTGRALNSYGVGEVPAGVLCGTNAGSGPFLVEGCAFNNLYDSTAQAGGGVVYTGTVQGLTVANCTFNNGGVYGNAALDLNTVRVTGCVFNAVTANLTRMGVEFSVGGGGPVFDVNVSDCAFKFNTSDTGPAVYAQADTVTRLVVADCTYTAVSAPGGIERFVRVNAAVNGEGVVIEGNAVDFPSDNALGPLLVQGVSSLTVADNNFMSANPSTATVLETNAKVVSYTGNTSVGMNGLALSGASGFLPTLNMTGNVIDGTDPTASVGVRVLPDNSPLTLPPAVFNGNTLKGCLDAVVLTNVLNTLALAGLTFTGNTVSGSRNGLTTDADNYANFAVTGNTFIVNNYAVYQSNAASSGKNVKVDANLVVQSAFVAPVVSLGLVMFTGAALTGASVSRNQFDHAGAVSAITLLLSGNGPEDVAVDENTVRNENASAAQAIVVAATVSNGIAAQVNNVSLSRNKVNHFGGGFAAIRLSLTGTVAGLNVFRNVRMDHNTVVVGQNNATNVGVDFDCTGSGIGNPALRGISLSGNSLLAYGPSVRFTATNVVNIEDVLICDNSTLAGNAASTGAVVFSNTFTGATPANASLSNVSVSRNSVKNNLSNYALRVTCAAPVANLSVDDNAVHQSGDVANPSPGTASVYLFLDNSAGFPTLSAASGVSVCRNKVTGLNTVQSYGEAAILLTSSGGLVTDGKNISVNGNEVFNHVGDALKVQLDYDALYNVSVSDNKVHTVEGRAIVVERATTVEGLLVSDNSVQGALSAGGAGDGTITVDLDGGNGFVFSGNRLGSASRRGFFVDGAGATSQLEAVTFSGNAVDFSGGAGAAEEGVYVLWNGVLADVGVTGNSIRSASTGVHIEGGYTTSQLLNPSTVQRVTVTGNTVTATDYGVWVQNHTTDSGAGTAELQDVSVTGNTVGPLALVGGMTSGVRVEAVFGFVQRAVVSNNTVRMGNTSTGDALAIDAGTGTPSDVTVTGNVATQGARGVHLTGSGAFSTCALTQNTVTSVAGIGVHVSGFNSLTNVGVNSNRVEGVTAAGLLTGDGVLLVGSTNANSRNVSVSYNAVRNVESRALFINATQLGGTPEFFNLSVCHNTLENWNTPGSVSTPAVKVTLCNNVANPHPLYNLNVSHNSCINATDDYVSGFAFELDEKTQQVVFAHNQVLLNNQANVSAMAWAFTNTGLFTIPKDFAFTGNLFRDTNSVVPSYTGTGGDKATFYGNIGSATNFWTGFATNWATYVPNLAISTHNIDDGT